jgi:hypothetical protein
MSDCDDVLVRVFLGSPLDPAATAHLEACTRCSEDAGPVRSVAGTLSADAAPPPPPGLAPRVLRAAAPLLAARARRARRRALAVALAVALAPLPLIIAIDVRLAMGGYHLLRSIMPAALSAYLVFNWTATVVLLLALTYAAIPILVDQQLRSRRFPVHA